MTRRGDGYVGYNLQDAAERESLRNQSHGYYTSSYKMSSTPKKAPGLKPGYKSKNPLYKYHFGVEELANAQTARVTPSRAPTLRDMRATDCPGLEYSLGFIDNFVNSRDLSQEIQEALSLLSDDISRSLDEFDYEVTGHNHARITSARARLASTMANLPGVGEVLKEASPSEQPKAMTPLQAEIEGVKTALAFLENKTNDVKKVPVGALARCIECDKEITRGSAGHVYCSNAGIGNCKDAFWRRVKGLRTQLETLEGREERAKTLKSMRPAKAKTVSDFNY